MTDDVAEGLELLVGARDCSEDHNSVVNSDFSVSVL